MLNLIADQLGQSRWRGFVSSSDSYETYSIYCYHPARALSPSIGVQVIRIGTLSVLASTLHNRPPWPIATT